MRINPSFFSACSKMMQTADAIKQEIQTKSKLPEFQSSFDAKKWAGVNLDVLLEASCLGYCQENYSPSIAAEAQLIQEGIKYLEENPIFFREPIPTSFSKATADIQQQSAVKDEKKRVGLIAEAVQNLHDNESYFISAGIEEHSLLVKITKKATGYDLFFYDASQGSERRQGGAITAEGTKGFPYIQFAEVSHDELFTPADPTLFFELLLAKTEVSFFGRTTPFEVYLGICLPFFSKKRAVSELLKERGELFLSVEKPSWRRVDNSAVKTFHCHFLDEFGDQKTAKQWTLALDFFTICSCYSAWEQSVNPTEAHERTAYRLHLATKRFLEQIGDYHELISEEDFLSAVATVTAIQEKAEAVLNAPKERAELIMIGNFAIAENEGFERSQALKTLPEKVISIGNAEKPVAAVKANLGKGCDWSDLTTVFNQALERMHPSDPVGTILQYQCLMSNLRHLKRLDSTITPQEALHIQDMLSACFQRYTEALHGSERELSQANINAMMETTLLQFVVAEKNAPSIRNYGLDFSHYQKVLHFFFHTSQDHEAMAHTTDLLEFIGALNKEKVLFSFLDPREWKLEQWINGQYPEADFHMAGFSEEERTVLQTQPKRAPEVTALVNQCSAVSPTLSDPPRRAAFYFVKQAALWGTELTIAKHSLKDQKISPVNPKFANQIAEPEFLGRTGWNYSWAKPISLIKGLKFSWSNLDPKTYGVIPLLKDPEAVPQGFSDDCKMLYKEKMIRRVKFSENELSRLWAQGGFQKYLVALCTESTQVSVILQDLANELAGLPKKEIASILFLLFKTAGQGDELRSPLFEKLRTDPNIVARLGLVVEKVFGVWSTDTEMAESLLLLLRMYGQLCYSSLEFYPEQVKQIDLAKIALYSKWVDEMSLDAHHNPACLLTKLALLLAPNFSDLSTVQKADLYLTTVEMKSKKSRYDHVSEAFFLMLKRYEETEANWTELFKDPRALREFASVVMQRVDPTFIPSGADPILADPLQISCSGKNGTGCTMDLLSLQVRLSTGELWSTAELQSALTTDLKRLRPTQQHLPQDRKYSGDSYTFTDPVWNFMRVSRYGDEKAKKEKIERCLDGVWQTYYSPDELKTIQGLHLNHALLFDHIAFVNNDDKVLSLYSREGKLLYRTNAEGELEQINHKGEGTKFFLSQDGIPPALLAFEDQEGICLFKHADGSMKIYLPRYSEQALFNWDQKNQRFTYCPDPSFYLNTSPKQLSWGFNRSLNLLSTDGRQAVMVPWATVNSQAFDKNCHITVSKTDQDGTRGSLRCAVFDVALGRLQASGLNENLFLALTLLAKKEYELALNAIQNVSMSDIPDESTWTLLNSFAPSGAQGEHAKWADATALRQIVILKAYLAVRRLRPFDAHLGTKNLRYGLRDSYQVYLGASKRVQKKVKLAAAEEMAVRNDLNFTKDDLRANFIQKKSKDTVVFDTDEPKLEMYFRLPQNFKPWVVLDSNWPSFNSFFTSKLFHQTYASIMQADPNSMDSWIYYLTNSKQVNPLTDIHLYLLIAICIAKKQTGITNLPMEIPGNPTEQREWCQLVRSLGSKFLEGRNSAKGIQSYFTLPTVTHHVHSQPVQHKEKTLYEQIDLQDVPECDQIYGLLMKSFLSEPKVEHDPVAEPVNPDLTPREARHAFYQRARELAAERVANRPTLLDESPQALAQLEASLSHTITSSKDLADQLGDYIFALSNRSMEDVHREAQRVARKVGLGKPLVSIEDVCRAIGDVGNTKTRLQKLNKNLTDKEMDDLIEATVQYMAEVTHERHLSWIRGKVRSKQPPDEIAYWLSMKRRYNAATEPFLLFSEWVSGLRFKPSQKTLIDRCNEMIKAGKNYVFKLMMGEGKSSVIFPTIAQLLANQTLDKEEDKRVFCMLAHHSQRTSALANFREFQKSRSGKDVVLMEATLEALNHVDKIEELIFRFRHAMDHQGSLFMLSDFPQILLLQFAQQCEEPGYDNKLLMPLATLIDLMMNHAVFCKDEVDIVLLTTTDTRVPVGEKVPLSGDHIDMIGSIYECLISPKLKNLVRVEENKQKSLSSADYWKHVVPEIGKILFDGFLTGFAAHEEACLRHIQHQILKADQLLADNPDTVVADLQDPVQRQNVAFLKELFHMKHHGNELEKQYATRIAHARDMIKEYLPEALSRAYNHDYGTGSTQPGQQSDGNVVHYNYVDTPSGTDFGDKIFKGMLAIQMALQRPVDAAELKFLKEKYHPAMMRDAARKSQHVSETPEGGQFARMTNVPILDLEKLGNMQNALDYVNADPLTRLAIRKESTAHHVYDYSHELRMCASDLERMPKSYVAASGTLYNIDTLSLVDHVDPDEATEGLVYLAIDKQIKEGLSTLQPVDRNDLKGTLKYAKSLSPEKRARWHGHMDASGSYQDDGTSENVAKKFLKFFVKHPDFEKDAVIYRHRFESGEKFAILKQGSTEPIPLNNTTKEEVARHIKDNSRVFYYIEEKDGTGLDWYLQGTKDDPYFATMNLGPDITSRSYLQFLIRLRRYMLMHQGAHFLVAKPDLAKFEGEAKDMNAVLFHQENKEADAVERQTHISFQDQITAIPKWKGIKELVQTVLTKGNLRKTFAKYKPFIYVKKEDKTNESIRIPEDEIDTLEILRNQHREAFDNTFPECKNERNTIVTKAANNPYFSKQASNLAGNQAAHQVQMMQQQQQQIQNQNLQQTQQQILNLLRQHQHIGYPGAYQEVDWIKDWQGGSPDSPSAQVSVSEFLDAKLEKGNTKPFAQCFPPNLSLTQNLRYSKTTALSVMDSEFKQTHFMLIVKNKDTKQYEGTLLSKFDFDLLKARLEKNPQPKTWLVNLQGDDEVHTKEAGPAPKNDQIENLIWYGNLFNGNASYLVDHLDHTRKIAKEYKGEIADQMGDYLLLKNCSTLSGMEQVLETGLVGAHRYNREIAGSEILCSDRRKLNQQLLMPIAQMTDDEIRKIDPSMVRLLPDEKLHLLQDPLRLNKLDNRQLQLVTPEQLQLIKHERLSQLTEPKLIQTLQDRAKIQALGTGSKQLQHIIPEQIPMLSDEQLFELPDIPRQFITDIEKDRIRTYIEDGKHLAHKQQEWLKEYLPEEIVVEETIVEEPVIAEEPIVEEIKEESIDPVMLEPIETIEESSAPSEQPTIEPKPSPAPIMEKIQEIIIDQPVFEEIEGEQVVDLVQIMELPPEPSPIPKQPAVEPDRVRVPVFQETVLILKEPYIEPTVVEKVEPKPQIPIPPPIMPEVPLIQPASVIREASEVYQPPEPEPVPAPAPKRTLLQTFFGGITTAIRTVGSFSWNLTKLIGLTVAVPFSSYARWLWWEQAYQTFVGVFRKIKW